MKLEGSLRDRRRLLLSRISDLEAKMRAATPAAATLAPAEEEEDEVEPRGPLHVSSEYADNHVTTTSSVPASLESAAVQHDRNESEIRWRKVGYLKDKEVWFALGYQAAVCVPLIGDEADKVSSHLRHGNVVVTALPGAKVVPKARQPVSGWVDYVVATASRLVESSAAFKNGITANPFERWRWYKTESKWSELILVAVHHNSTVIAMIEERLIAVLGEDPRCANRAPGGEGEDNMHGPPFFAYVVVAH